MISERGILLKWFAVAALAFTAACVSAEPLPAGLRGSWRITRILPTHNVSCWGQEQAAKLLNSRLTYSEHSLGWQGGTVPLQGIVTREITAEEFVSENSGGSAYGINLNMIGIHTASVVEVDLQHEDADITGASTEVPGDVVLLAGPNRIVMSACGVYYEATRIVTPVGKKRR